MDNQNNISTQPKTTINVQIPTISNISNRRQLVPLSFAIAIVCFFFTFCEFKCQGKKINSVTGVDFVTGTELKGRDMFSGNETKGEKMPANVWAIFALGAGIVGLGIYLLRDKREAIIGAGAGAIGIVSLIILQFVIKGDIEKKGGGQIETDFVLAYWIALIAMILGAFISYLRTKQRVNIANNIAESEINKVSNEPENKISSSQFDKPQINLQIMHKQKKIILIAALLGFIAMFLPWGGLTIFGTSGGIYKGMDIKYSLLPLLCFIIIGGVLFLGNQTENLKTNLWFITLICGALALVFIIWHLFAMDSGYSAKYGIYIAALAAIGVVAAAFLLRAPEDSIKKGFDNLKKDISSKINTPGSGTTNSGNNPL